MFSPSWRGPRVLRFKYKCWQNLLIDRFSKDKIQQNESSAVGMVSMHVLSVPRVDDVVAHWRVVVN